MTRRKLGLLRCSNSLHDVSNLQLRSRKRAKEIAESFNESGTRRRDTFEFSDPASRSARPRFVGNKQRESNDALKRRFSGKTAAPPEAYSSHATRPYSRRFLTTASFCGGRNPIKRPKLCQEPIALHFQSRVVFQFAKTAVRTQNDHELKWRTRPASNRHSEYPNAAKCRLGQANNQDRSHRRQPRQV